jgi:MFS family permease
MLAPVLLGVLRFIQGMGAGGELGVAVVYLQEVSLPGTKGVTASLAQAAAGVGALAATGVCQFLRLHCSQGEGGAHQQFRVMRGKVAMLSGLQG